MLASRSQPSLDFPGEYHGPSEEGEESRRSVRPAANIERLLSSQDKQEGYAQGMTDLDV